MFSSTNPCPNHVSLQCPVYYLLHETHGGLVEGGESVLILGQCLSSVCPLTVWSTLQKEEIYTIKHNFIRDPSTNHLDGKNPIWTDKNVYSYVYVRMTAELCCVTLAY